MHNAAEQLSLKSVCLKIVTLKLFISVMQALRSLSNLIINNQF